MIIHISLKHGIMNPQIVGIPVQRRTKSYRRTIVNNAHWAEALTGIRKLSIFPLFVITLNPYNSG